MPSDLESDFEGPCSLVHMKMISLKRRGWNEQFGRYRVGRLRVDSRLSPKRRRRRPNGFSYAYAGADAQRLQGKTRIPVRK